MQRNWMGSKWNAWAVNEFSRFKIVNLAHLSADFHGRPSSSSRFMGSKGVIKDGFTDEVMRMSSSFIVVHIFRNIFKALHGHDAWNHGGGKGTLQNVAEWRGGDCVPGQRFGWGQWMGLLFTLPNGIHPRPVQLHSANAKLFGKGRCRGRRVEKVADLRLCTVRSGVSYSAAIDLWLCRQLWINFVGF